MAGKIAIAVLLAGVLVAAGVAIFRDGDTSDGERAYRTLAAVRPELAGADPRLKAINAQASELLAGGAPAFEKRVDSLRGIPIVVNKWGSWCDPCRREFPAFQGAARELGGDVAFLGDNVADSEADASKFLRRFPLPYPSYVDGDLKISAELRPAGFTPVTGFYNRTGKLVKVHAGPYDTAEELVRDIKRYAQAG